MLQEPNATPNIFPFLRYQDAPAALEWLARAFGFQKLMEVTGADGSIDHAEMSFGSGVIMLSSPRDPRRTERPRDPDAVEQGLYLYVDDVDTHYQRAKAAGAEIVRGLHDTEYGSREYGALDLEGYFWSFGTYRPAT